PVAVPRARLVVRTADGRRMSLVLDGRPVSIGRAPDNVVRIDDPRVSRHHALIVPRAGGFVLVDLGSTNGTWVDGLRVSELALGLGDRIDIAGAAELRLEATESGPTPADAGPR
ncbi:MAG: FHA domain-containing protein, partial [Candidatus Rokubacteria bacterium]|nr:FHA domain-containing protein [Candidatus Rokubacteria bacterium]